MIPPEQTLAAEAQKLDDNPVLHTALAALRATALEALAELDPFDTNALIAAQSDLRAIANLRSAIKAMVLAGQGQRHRPVA